MNKRRNNVGLIGGPPEGDVGPEGRKSDRKTTQILKVESKILINSFCFQIYVPKIETNSAIKFLFLIDNFFRNPGPRSKFFIQWTKKLNFCTLEKL